jgi:hypothetical protein
MATDLAYPARHVTPPPRPYLNSSHTLWYAHQGMRRFRRRLAALVSGALLLQLVLVGSGFACIMPAMGGTSAAATADVASMPGMDMSTDLQGSTQQPASNQAPCHPPWVPASCQPMAPCAPAAVTSPALVLSLPRADVNDVVALVVLAPASRSTAPELPPPRA